jgi:uncharacterized protein
MAVQHQFENQELVLEEMVNVLVKAINPERVVLFGSRAKGEAREDSDLDLLIIEREPFGPNRSRRQVIRHIRQMLSGFRVPKDILVYSLDEVSKWQHSLNHILAKCLREGKVLYARH